MLKVIISGYEFDSNQSTTIHILKSLNHFSVIEIIHEAKIQLAKTEKMLNNLSKMPHTSTFKTQHEMHTICSNIVQAGKKLKMEKILNIAVHINFSSYN